MRHTDLTMICTLLLTVLSVPGQSGHAKEPKRPHVILIIADEMAWDDCGVFENPKVRTSNIEWLARVGMRFDRAFVTASSCSPSRSSLITGRHPHNTEAEELHWPLPELREARRGLQPLPEQNQAREIGGDHLLFAGLPRDA